MKSFSYTPFISPNSQSLRTELHFQFICFAADYTPVRFGLLSHRARSDLRNLRKCGLKRTEQDRAEGHHHVIQCIVKLSLRIIRCRTSHWQLHRRRLRLLTRTRFQNTSRGSSRPPTQNATFLTPVSNNAGFGAFTSNALCLWKRLWLRIIGLIWKGYVDNKYNDRRTFYSQMPINNSSKLVSTNFFTLSRSWEWDDLSN